MERHFLRDILITVHMLFNEYLNLFVEEFFEQPGYLREHNFKIHQPRFRFARRKAAFAVRSAGPWNKQPLHITEATTVSSFKDRLDTNWCSIFPDIVWHYPIDCSYVNGLGAPVLIFRPLNLSW